MTEKIELALAKKTLSARYYDIFEMSLNGATTRDIAKCLNVSNSRAYQLSRIAKNRVKRRMHKEKIGHSAIANLTDKASSNIEWFFNKGYKSSMPFEKIDIKTIAKFMNDNIQAFSSLPYIGEKTVNEVQCFIDEVLGGEVNTEKNALIEYLLKRDIKYVGRKSIARIVEEIQNYDRLMELNLTSKKQNKEVRGE